MAGTLRKVRDLEVILISTQKFEQNIFKMDLSTKASLPWTSMTDKEPSHQIHVLPRLTAVPYCSPTGTCLQQCLDNKLSDSHPPSCHSAWWNVSAPQRLGWRWLPAESRWSGNTREIGWQTPGASAAATWPRKISADHSMRTRLTPRLCLEGQGQSGLLVTDSTHGNTHLLQHF